MSVEDAMAIRVQCPECDQVYQFKDELAGKSVRCKSCGRSIAVRAKRPAPKEDEYEVAEDDEEEFDELVARPGRGSKSNSGSQVGGQKKGRSRDNNSFNVRPWIFGGLGPVVLIGLLACGGLFFAARRAIREAVDGNPQELQERERVVGTAVLTDVPDPGSPTSLYPVERYPLPTFPEFRAGQPVPGSEVLVQNLTLRPLPDKALQPAFAMQMRVYLPAGEHAPATLP